MYSISKITSASPVDFAAEELKKYLRMMMPRRGEIPIAYDREAKTGFRLGLMSDFKLDVSKADDVKLDDILHIDADEQGGIIAGSNPRSVLLAVYRYLYENGCRFLFPGIDGEFIPMQAIKPVFYHKMADNRYRGQCNEGSVSQQNMLEAIDFAPKIGLNIYMLEFDIPYYYYNRWYSHSRSTVKQPEPVTPETVLQWKRMCEAEISKRGLQYHDMGHGWTCEPFGIDSTMGWTNKGEQKNEIPQEYLAEINGKREFYKGIPLTTNICMSNEKARKIMVDYIAAYAEVQNNVDFLHVWLGDDCNNHCECDRCTTQTSSDWYVLLLNELDKELEKRKLHTHIVFLMYYDTLWPPVVQKLRNPKRFTMLLAPITRVFSDHYDQNPEMDALMPNNRNHLILPRTMAQMLAYLVKWREIYDGDCMVYEYHFHWAHYRDPGYQAVARCLYDDIRSLPRHHLKGFIEDQTQRCGFPTGFPVYVYGMALFDSSLSFDDVTRDYFPHAFGDEWELAERYLNKVSEAFDFSYMCGLNAAVNQVDSKEKSVFYDPRRLEAFESLHSVFDEFDQDIKRNLVQKYRVASVSWQLLQYHTRFCRLIAKAYGQKCVGNHEKALEYQEQLRDEMSKSEDALQRYLDMNLYFSTTKEIFGNK